MPRKRGETGTSPPSVHLWGCMDWATAEANFWNRRWREMGSQEMDNWDYKGASSDWSIAHLWSYRGRLWKKYEGSYPKPEEVGLPANHPFFDPDHVCVGESYDCNGKLLGRTVRWRGRKIKPGHRMFPSLDSQVGHHR